MAGDKMYQAMKEIAKSKGIKASHQHDLYKMNILLTLVGID